MMSVMLEKTLKYLTIQKAYGIKIPDYRLCKGIFLCFFSTLKDINKHKVKQILELAKTL